MGRRYTIGQYRSRIEPLEDFNLTTDVIVGFPTEDEPGVREHDGGSRGRSGSRRCTSFPTRRDPARGRPLTIPCRRRSRRSGARACGQHPMRRAARGGSSRVGSDDVVLVDRPGLGYADDYTPWLIDAQVGSMVPARAVGVADEGVLAVVAA